MPQLAGSHAFGRHSVMHAAGSHAAGSHTLVQSAGSKAVSEHMWYSMTGSRNAWQWHGAIFTSEPNLTPAEPGCNTLGSASHPVIRGSSLVPQGASMKAQLAPAPTCFRKPLQQHGALLSSVWPPEPLELAACYRTAWLHCSRLVDCSGTNNSRAAGVRTACENQGLPDIEALVGHRLKGSGHCSKPAWQRQVSGTQAQRGRTPSSQLGSSSKQAQGKWALLQACKAGTPINF